MTLFIAHTANKDGKQQSLTEHLENVSRLAADFAYPFDAAEAARLLGQWHDLGKYHPDFQRYLLLSEANPKRKFQSVDHKAAGASLALQYRLDPLAMLIQGHHGGLKSPTDLKSWFADKADHGAEALVIAEKQQPILRESPDYTLPADIMKDMHAAEFYLRMLFSALVDADFLDTEAHFNPRSSVLRKSAISLKDMWSRFEQNQEQLMVSAEETYVNRLRRSIYDSCIAASAHEPGLFRMTVPTGGGKTRSGLAFALRHAMQHSMKHIIVAVPFISITTQTAEVYRKIFKGLSDSDTMVLEHHSGVSQFPNESDEYAVQRIRSRLAAENWDAPVVVTTTVQLFESLFASSTSRCRRLHRLSNSVIILDEVQSLPIHLLDPILDSIRQLTERFHSTVVLSTATQPAFETLPIFENTAAHEIAPNPAELFAGLKRVNYEWRMDQPMSWTAVAEETLSSPQSMIIVNTKKDAMALLDAVETLETNEAKGSPVLHLSTLLCGAHRLHVLNEVKRRLNTGEPCTLISTQVVEAGVDIDFPVVLRALGPLTSIIQAAGRANREGKLQSGRIVIFVPDEGGMPPGSYSRATQTTHSMLHMGPPNMDDPDAVCNFFSMLYPIEETDKNEVQKSRQRLDYPETTKRFRMIEQDTVDVVVSYGTREEQETAQFLIENLRTQRVNPRLALRRLQPYIVSIYQHQVETYQRHGLLEGYEVITGLYEWHGKYDPIRGLVAEGKDPDVYVL